MVPT